jgi:hypothetical protein
MTALILTPAISQARAIERCFIAGGARDRIRFGEATPQGLFERAACGAPLTVCADPFSKFDSVIPTGSLDTAFMLRRFGAVRLGQVTMEPSSSRWYDKPWSLAFADSVGVTIPRTWGNAAEIPPNFGRVFYKQGLEGAGGAHTWVETPADLPEDVRHPGSGFIFQEKIEAGEVYCFGFLADRGRIVAGAGLLARVPAGGSAAVMELFDDPQLTAAAGRLISASDYSGWGLVEFRRCPRRDTYVLMEVNAKFWASIELVLRTQPAFAKLLFGLSVPAERMTKLWWPGRLAMMGIDHWPKHLPAIRGARMALEHIPLASVARALLPYRLQTRLAVAIRKQRRSNKATP